MSLVPNNSFESGRFPKHRMRPLAALRAAIRLFRNTQDTEQVGLLEIALGGYSRMQEFERFMQTQTGRAVVSERRSLAALLDDNDHLRSLPANSLGRHYLAHMEFEGLSVQGLLDSTPAMTEHLAKKPEAIRLFLDYAVRSAHDLHHVLAGYGRDELGEACVLAMSYEQVRIKGYKVISTVGPFAIRQQLRRLKVDRRGVFAAIKEAARIGRTAAWFPALDVKTILGEDLDALRARLNIQKPVIYDTIVSRVRANSEWASGPWVHVPTPERAAMRGAGPRHTAF